MLTQNNIVSPESSETLTVLPDVLGKETGGKEALGRWLAAPSSVGAGMSVGRGNAWDCSVDLVVTMGLTLSESQ